MKFTELQDKETLKWEYGLLIGRFFLTSELLNYIRNKRKKQKEYANSQQGETEKKNE